MATWPESSPTPNYPLILTPRFNTRITTFESGKEQRTARWLFPKYDVVVQYDVISASEAQTLWQFFCARRGAQEAFYIYDLSSLASVTKQHLTQYCGTGDGTTTTFDLPGKSTSSHIIYSDGSAEDSEDYTILSGSGTSSSDRVEYDTAPDEGTVVTATFHGYLRIRVRFEEDTLSQELFTTNLFRYNAIALKGLAAE